jgi:hypothetical protein
VLASSRRPWRRPKATEAAFFFPAALAPVPAISGYPPDRLLLPRASPKFHATPRLNRPRQRPSYHVVVAGFPDHLTVGSSPRPRIDTTVTAKATPAMRLCSTNPRTAALTSSSRHHLHSRRPRSCRRVWLRPVSLGPPQPPKSNPLIAVLLQDPSPTIPSPATARNRRQPPPAPLRSGSLGSSASGLPARVGWASLVGPASGSP